MGGEALNSQKIWGYVLRASHCGADTDSAEWCDPWQLCSIT